MSELSKFGKSVASIGLRDVEVDNISTVTSIYENEIPLIVESELERLYESVYTTVERLGIYGGIENVSTFILREGDNIKDIFLFTRGPRYVKVLNQQIFICNESIDKFVKIIFSRYSGVKYIDFYAVKTDLSSFSLPFIRYRAIEENILILPDTREEYLASLVSAFRRNIRSAERKIKNDFPSFRFEVFTNNNASVPHVREIIRLGGLRMAAKQKEAYIGDNESEDIIKLIWKYGNVHVATIEGKICGGSICYTVGRRNFMHVIAHDPNFDKYMIGHLVQIFTLYECIERGNLECWLMGGGEYKSRYGAKLFYFESILIFRNRFEFILNLEKVFLINCRKFAILIIEELKKFEKRSGFRTVFANHQLILMLNLRRLINKVLGWKK